MGDLDALAIDASLHDRATTAGLRTTILVAIEQADTTVGLAAKL